MYYSFFINVAWKMPHPDIMEITPPTPNGEKKIEKIREFVKAFPIFSGGGISAITGGIFSLVLFYITMGLIYTQLF